ncbi:hypothetical protein [Azospirillum sp. TSO5]|uniref:hypothetical protein n=1 Tax=Azospirillum sp. TSO5 TaxID=716760 RepID=UPI0011B233A2|nr:hypothetical protein [Azospirillum sp. TSO5]
MGADRGGQVAAETIAAERAGNADLVIAESVYVKLVKAEPGIAHYALALSGYRQVEGANRRYWKY